MSRESRGGRPGRPVPNSPYGLCGRKATLNSNYSLWYLRSRQWTTLGVIWLSVALRTDDDEMLLNVLGCQLTY